MAPHSPQKTPLERARAEISTLNRTFETDLDKFRTASQEYDTHISALRTSFQEKQQSAIINVENALKLSEKRNHDIEHSLQQEKHRVAALTSELLTQKQEAKTKHDEVVVELASQKLNHGLVKVDLKNAKSELEEADRRAAKLEKDLEAAERENRILEFKCAGAVYGENRLRQISVNLDAAKKREIQLQAELELLKREPVDLRKRLKASEQHNVDLKADLQAATQRASTAKDELKAFKSRFKQINDDMTALASSSGQQPIVAQPVSSQPVSSQLVSSALAPVEEGSVEKRDSGPETNDALTQPQGLDSHVSNTKSNKESDLLHCQSILAEVMNMKNWQYNQYFLKVMDSLTLASLDGKVGPMNLGIMKEKLAKGAYTSSTSFKADFDLIVADCRRLNPPKNPIRIAAEQLSEIIEQAFSAQPISSHQSSANAISNPGTSNRKRKAETDTLASFEGRHVQKRRSLAPLEQNTDRVQPAIPDTGGSVVPVSPSSGQSPSSDQSKDNFPSPAQTNANQVKGQITTGARLEIDATCSTVAQLVSVTKLPSTITGHWESLVPNHYRLTAHALPSTVKDRIFGLVHDLAKDMIILRLLPAAGVDKPEFNRVLEYLIQRERFASVSHIGIDNVEDIYLIPASKAASYPIFLPTLDVDSLPPTKTEDVLFMAIIFGVAEDKQRQVRDAWDGRMKAIQNHDEGGLLSMRNTLLRNPLQIFRNGNMVVSSAKRHLHRFRDLPYSKDIPSPEIQAYGQDVLQLSYPLWHKAVWQSGPRPSLCGAVAPEWVFVLGRVLGPGRYYGLLVIDIQKRDRPLWLIRNWYQARSPSKRDITLLGIKFPGSLNEWEETLPASLALEFHPRCLKKTGVKSERCRLPG